MKPIDYLKADPFNEITLFRRKMLFTPLRIDRSSLPEGIYRYDIRHSDEDWGDPCTVERNVLVNHYGCILTDRKLNLGDNGYLEIDSDKDFIMSGNYIQPDRVNLYFERKKRSRKCRRK